MIRIDLSPPDFIHVPQAPRIERRTFCTRTPDNEWHMWTAGSVTADGERLGLSNHTWSHLDAPFHLLPQGPTFEQLDPRHYLALDARLVDLTSSDTGRRETVNGVNYHTRVDVADLPADLDAFEAVLFVTGFAALYASGYPMQAGADAHYPHVTREAAERLAGCPRDSAWPASTARASTSPRPTPPRIACCSAGPRRRSCCSRRSRSSACALESGRCLRACCSPSSRCGHSARTPTARCRASTHTRRLPGEEAEFAAFSKALRTASLISA